MEVREYISIRRAYNLVRRETPAKERLAFEELAVLAHLLASEKPLRTSEIASYQNVLRPTMTHRTSHLEKLGLILRETGPQDRRSVCCSITDKGASVLFANAEALCEKIPNGHSLYRVTNDRILKYIDAMGAVYLTASELILLRLGDAKDGLNVSALSNDLGMLQPTVSMSVAGLEEQKLLVRKPTERKSSSLMQLTAAGKKQAADIATSIAGLVVRRSRRG